MQSTVLWHLDCQWPATTYQEVRRSKQDACGGQSQYLICIFIAILGRTDACQLSSKLSMTKPSIRYLSVSRYRSCAGVRKSAGTCTAAFTVCAQVKSRHRLLDLTSSGALFGATARSRPPLYRRSAQPESHPHNKHVVAVPPPASG